MCIYFLVYFYREKYPVISPPPVWKQKLTRPSSYGPFRLPKEHCWYGLAPAFRVFRGGEAIGQFQQARGEILRSSLFLKLTPSAPLSQVKREKHRIVARRFKA